MDAERLRQDFPVLQRTWPNGNLVYLDNACSSLKPRPVIDAVREYYEEFPVCGERSVHRLGRAVTERVDESRRAVARFVGARSPEEIVYTKNATEAINLVAHATPWSEGDVVVTTDKEHNSNWVPWLHLRQTRGVRLLRVPSRSDGSFDEDAFKATLDVAGDRLRLVSLVHSSNADGYTNPLSFVVREAHKRGARVLADAAQSVPHHPVDVGALDVDFLAVSLHKMLAPSGAGFLYGKREALSELGPFLLGGGTVRTSTPEAFEWHDLPNRFEAGLQNFSALYAVPAALEYLTGAGLEPVESHERRLNELATRGLEALPHVTVHGPPARLRSGIVPFTVEGLDPQDVALYLDERRNVAVRAGSFCVNAYVNGRDPSGWVRASLYLYNTTEDVEAFVATVEGLARGLRLAGGKAPVPTHAAR